VTVLFAVCGFAIDLPKDLDVGVYVVQGADPKELSVKTVSWKSGGVVKDVLTAGIIKGDLTGRIRGGFFLRSTQEAWRRRGKFTAFALGIE
jgi:hypothetical protein